MKGIFMQWKVTNVNRARLSGLALLWQLFGLVVLSVCMPLWAQSAGPGTGGPPRIPPEAFYAPGQIESAALSPSGRWLAVGAGVPGGRIGLVVFDLEGKTPVTSLARFSDVDVSDIRWVNEDWLVHSIADRTLGGGDQTWYPGLFSVRRDGSDRRELIAANFAGVSEARPGRQALLPNHHLLRAGLRSGNEVIVGEHVFSGRELVRVIAKRLDVATGRATSISLGVPGNPWDWYFDADGEPRAVVLRAEGRGAIHWRSSADAGWKRLAEFDWLRPPFWPHQVDTEGKLFVTQTSGRVGERELHSFNFETGKPDAEALVSTPGFDFAGQTVSELPGSRTLGVRVLTDAEATAWFEPRLTALQKEADRRLPGQVNRIQCRRCESDDIVALVSSWSDRDPGQYWLYRGQDKSWRKLGQVRQAIDPQRMGETDMQRVQTRDGLSMPVWVTRPQGAGKAALPAVVLVHGGPWARGRSWNWNADAQFLASRGYVVIEAEFRGSTGYGAAHFEAGWRQWGRAMQDDLIDALDWAVGKGWVNRDRVCIAGASYGGYATLMGLSRHPDRFRCGAAWVAVTDPALLFQWRADSDGDTMVRVHSLPQLIGDPVKDAEQLAQVTPVRLAASIKAPVLLAFGALDTRVPLVHGTRMREALIAAGNPPEWTVYDGEWHGWYKVDNRLDFARRLETFLGKYLQ
jgi:dienelactone hydrolase